MVTATIMTYPTPKEIETASSTQLALWLEFLPKPGSEHVNKKDFVNRMKEEDSLLLDIRFRLKAIQIQTATAAE